MKVGVLTFTSSINYGALLQCYALQEMLIALGHKVEIIDYKQPYIEAEYFAFKKNKCIIFKPLSLLRCLKKFRRNYPLLKKRNRFKSEYLNLTVSCDANTIPQDFDVYLIGSDQLWTTVHTGGIDKVFWGDFKRPSSSKLYSYAISADEKSLKTVSESFLKRQLECFECVSVRESYMKELIEKYTLNSPQVDIDPTMLPTRSFWKSKIKPQKWRNRNYIVMYQVRRLSWSENHLYEEALKLANKLNCEIIDLSDYKLGAIDFISAIYYSRFVITTSFHGAVFSVIFQKPLNVYMLNDGHDARCCNLLKTLGMLNCVREIGEDACAENVNYEYVEQTLDVLRKKSLKYLANIC